MESLKKIEGYDDYYLLPEGIVISVKKKAKALSLKTGKRRQSEYPRVSLLKNGVQKTRYVHQLILSAYKQKPDDALIVNHKDGDKENNSIDNLEWCTYSYNNSHAYNYGLKSCSPVVAKPINGMIGIWAPSATDAAKWIGIKYMTGVCKVLRGELKKHKNYLWRICKKKEVFQNEKTWCACWDKARQSKSYL
jgi:hypothetical protein